MSGVHKYPTISFRVSPSEKEQIEAKIIASGMLKKDYFIRSCIYNRICVVGKKETVYVLVEKLQEMLIRMKEINMQLTAEKVTVTSEEIIELQKSYEDMLKAIIKVLDGASYLWQGKNDTNEKSPDSGNC